MVESVRKRFLAEYERDKQSYIEKDVERVRKQDFTVRRYIYGAKLNLDEAFEMLKNALRWRKEIGFEGAHPTRFPLEFYKVGCLFPYENDNDGYPVLYCRFKVHKKLQILQDAVKKFLVFNMEIMDTKLYKERSWGVVFDASGSSLSNVDFDLLLYLIKAVKYYYPWCLRYIIVYELPWFLEPAWKVAMLMVPEEGRRLFLLRNKNNITEVIKRENLPDFMGGSCARNYREVPEGARSAEEVAAIEMGLNQEEVEKIRSHYKEFLPDN
ncbi:Motile sperm domain-containing protein 2-like protein [Dinothrombium tinctorium]|uniref:Motile sperm domain-containing protein 2-like protein n=1 Tax=Dinothrombium tinctorium TaxID=1965070 RepID=A0A3S3P1C6_9ACAR|nr:Motile sperm domain-containing protein 2-like protein [Dinothrombium tinctorium]